MTKYNKFESYERDNISEKELKEAQRKAGFLGSLGNKFLLIVRMVESALMKHEYKINKMDLVKLIAAIIYVASPIDAVPDVIVGLGYVDDIAVVKIILESLYNVIKDYERFEIEKNISK